jgi:hypothetical protein
LACPPLVVWWKMSRMLQVLPTDGCYAADRATLTFLQKPMSTYSGFSMFVERILHPKSYSCIYIYIVPLLITTSL